MCVLRAVGLLAQRKVRDAACAEPEGRFHAPRCAPGAGSLERWLAPVARGASTLVYFCSLPFGPSDSQRLGEKRGRVGLLAQRKV